MRSSAAHAYRSSSGAPGVPNARAQRDNHIAGEPDSDHLSRTAFSWSRRLRSRPRSKYSSTDNV
eukprot:6686648-Prymnesium_polylepis.1